ncbi:MAG: sulfatase [Anaerolineae bacterium]|nr:sulfatase [Anaerolineae bacterium]
MKNIVLLITDTYRFDNLFDRAAQPVRTPALDRFAGERATEITRFYTGSFPTIPHRTDVATGVLGWPHYGWQPIDVSGPNHIGTLLRAQGYATQLICDCPHLFNSRFQFGFDAAYQNRGQEGDRFLLHLNDPIANVLSNDKTRLHPSFRGHHLADLHRWLNRYPQYEDDTFPAKTGRTAIRWLEENCNFSPFFLWVDLFDPHEPWDAPEYLVRRYDPNYDGPPMFHPNYGPSSAYSEAELHNLWAHYAAEAELIDRWLGRVLQKMDDLQLWDDTILVITSDHGMSIGEHARTGKSNINDHDARYWPIYPEIGHVPFLIAGSDVPHGQTLDIFAQPVDILPTLCELAGVNVGAEKPVEGRSFASIIREGEGAHRDCAVSGCYVHTRDGVPPRKATTPFVTTEKWGYAPVGALGRPELYDLAVDPMAENDLAADHPQEVKAMHDLLIQHLIAHHAPDAFVELWQDAADQQPGEGKWAIDYAD